MRRVIHTLYDDGIELEEEGSGERSGEGRSGEGRSSERNEKETEKERGGERNGKRKRKVIQKKTEQKKRRRGKDSSTTTTSTTTTSTTTTTTTSCSLTPEEEEILIQKKAADVLLLTSLTNSDAFIERPSVPKCQGGCEGELGVAQYASGVNYPHGEWICDSCEESSTGPRWTCTEECEYDLCCDCAKVSFIEIHRWEKRIQLLEKLVSIQLIGFKIISLGNKRVSLFKTVISYALF